MLHRRISASTVNQKQARVSGCLEFIFTLYQMIDDGPQLHFSNKQINKKSVCLKIYSLMNKYFINSRSSNPSLNEPITNGIKNTSLHNGKDVQRKDSLTSLGQQKQEFQIGSPRYAKTLTQQQTKSWMSLKPDQKNSHESTPSLQFVAAPSNPSNNTYTYFQTKYGKSIEKKENPGVIYETPKQAPTKSNRVDGMGNIYSKYKATLTEIKASPGTPRIDQNKVFGSSRVNAQQNGITEKLQTAGGYDRSINKSAYAGQIVTASQPTPEKIQVKSLNQVVTSLPQKFFNDKAENKPMTSSSQEHTNHDSKLALHRSLSPGLQKKYYLTEALQSLTANLNAPHAQQFRENINQNYQSLKLVQQLTSPTFQEIDERKINLGPYNPKLKYRKTIVFDLDETLVHCNSEYTKDADIQTMITFPTGEEVAASVNIRPFAIQILKQLSRLCEVIVFTASHSCYAQKVIQELDPTGEMIARLIDRESCIQTKEGVYVKDLRVLGRDLSDVVLVDNALYSFGFQITNGIPIVSYYEGKNDQQLLSLYSFIINELLPARDVRPIIARYFKMLEWLNFGSGREAVSKLYDLSSN